jgi:hypothetical protein
VLFHDEIPSLGMKALSEYLRAMGEVLTRNEQKDRNMLEKRLYDALKSRRVSQWVCTTGHVERKKPRKSDAV